MHAESSCSARHRDGWAALASRAAGIAVVLTLAGCANSNISGTFEEIAAKLQDSTAVQVPFLVPAMNSESSALRSMVVASGPQPLAAALAGSVEASLLKLRVAEQPYYRLVKLDAPRAQPPGESALAALARQHGTQGALGLAIAGLDTQQFAQQEDRQDCTVKTALFKACPKDKTVTRKVACTLWRSQATSHLRVVRAADSRSVFAATLAGVAERKSCPDDVQPVSRQDAEAAAVSDLVDKILKTVAPTVELRPLDLKEADARLPAEMRERFDAARSFALGKRLDEACTRFNELYDDFKESVALAYDVGFCHEARGDLLRASQTYRRASELAGRPDAQIDRRLGQVERLLKERPVAFAHDAGPGDTPVGKSGIAPTGRRVALIVGNGRYQKSALVNPVNDARLIGDRVKKLGFDVTVVENADSARFGSAVRDFTQRARGADVAFFFYAGHAVQNGVENLMMPVDNARFREFEDVRSGGGVSVLSVIAQLDVASPRVKLIVLDACRDNPLPASARSLGSSGLSRVEKIPEGTLIAYATAPGRTAEDGTGRNSVFSKHLARALARPNLTIEQVFREVREGVRAETGSRQEPMEHNSLVGELVLNRS